MIERIRRVATLVAIGLFALVVACGGSSSDSGESVDTQAADAPAAASEAAAPTDGPAVAADVKSTGGSSGPPDDGGLPIPPARFPRGLVHSGEGVSPGYVLFSPLLSGTTHLVDNDGRVVHSWETPYAGGGGMYLLPNGNLLRPRARPGCASVHCGRNGWDPP